MDSSNVKATQGGLKDLKTSMGDSGGSDETLEISVGPGSKKKSKKNKKRKHKQMAGGEGSGVDADGKRRVVFAIGNN